MHKKYQYRYALLLVTVIVLSVVSLMNPEAAEGVARAFLLLWGASW